MRMVRGAACPLSAPPGRTWGWLEVHLRIALGGVADGQPCGGELTPGGAETLRQLAILQQSPGGPDERLLVAGLDKQGNVGEQLAEVGHARGEDRRSGGQRLQRSERHPLAGGGWEGERIRRGEQSRD